MEALEVLMGFHQSQMSRQVLFLHKLNPAQRMLKPSYQMTKIATSICRPRPTSLYPLTYPSSIGGGKGLETCWGSVQRVAMTSSMLRKMPR